MSHSWYPWVCGAVAVLMANIYGDNIDADIGDEGRNVAVGKGINQNDNRTYNYGKQRDDQLSPLDRIRQLEQEIYGNERSGEPGLIQRMRSMNRWVQVNTLVELLIVFMLILVMLKF